MTPDEQKKMVEEIERDLERLHALYNQYFMGIEKIEPTIYRKNLDRKIYQLRSIQIQNTALRFRFQMQIQKYNTQSIYWNRVCKQIEQGTYTRHVMLAKRRVEARHGRRTQSSSPLDSALFFEEDAPPSFDIDLAELDIDLDEPFTVDRTPSRSSIPPSIPPAPPIDSIDDPFDDGPSKAAQPIPPRRPTPEKGLATLKRSISPQTSAPPVNVPGAVFSPPGAARNGNTSVPAEPSAGPARPRKASLTQEQTEAIYKKYLVAKKRCKESIDNLSYGKVAKSLQKTYDQSGAGVDFKVVIRNGKAIIKTVKAE